MLLRISQTGCDKYGWWHRINFGVNILTNIKTCKTIAKRKHSFQYSITFEIINMFQSSSNKQKMRKLLLFEQKNLQNNNHYVTRYYQKIYDGAGGEYLNSIVELITN